MKTRRQHAAEDALTISRRVTPPPTSIGNSETIPTDLIIQILSRLPAKSIAICRCVSKFWASLLRCTDFTELFMIRSRARPRFLFCCLELGELFFFSTPQLQNPEENSFVVAENHRLRFPFNGSSQISCPLGGLVCLKHYLMETSGKKETVWVIYNPSTGQTVTSPKVETKTRRTLVKTYLGFDPIDKLFKLLAMTTPGNKDSVYGQRVCEEHQVLTIGTQNLSWRKIKCCISHYYNDYDNDAICIDGCLYYVAAVEKGPSVKAIVSFDVRSEKFTIVNKDEDMVLCDYSTLVNYKGKLGVCVVGEARVVTGQTMSLELWVLVDAEKHEWSKHLYVLPPLWKNVVAELELYFVGITGEKEIVFSTLHLSNPFYVYYYNIKDNTVKRVEIQGICAFKNIRVHASLDHVEDVKLMQNV